jgi:hypothetical protein
MALMLTATDAIEISSSVWALTLPAHEVRLLGPNQSAVGEKSVIMLKQSSYDREAKTLSFPIDGVVILNVGTTSSAIAIAERSPDGASAAMMKATSSDHVGPGDKEFLRLCRDRLSPEMAEAAKLLLDGVRSRASGDLKRGKSLNFSETPDNFWYVIVQPRVQQLSITVRGDVTHFKPMANLPVKDDRGNTLFKVSAAADVPAAIDMIFHARRKSRS